MAVIAFAIAFGFAFGAWREVATTSRPSAAGLILVVLVGMAAAYRAGRVKRGGSASATAVAVASSEASAAATVQVVNVVPGMGPARWQGLDGAGWMVDGPTALTDRDLLALGDDVDDCPELSDRAAVAELASADDRERS